MDPSTETLDRMTIAPDPAMILHRNG